MADGDEEPIPTCEFPGEACQKEATHTAAVWWGEADDPTELYLCNDHAHTNSWQNQGHRAIDIIIGLRKGQEETDAGE